jgi:hypothetical protein
MRFLKDTAAIETAEVAVIIAVVVLVACRAYQIWVRRLPGRARCRRQNLEMGRQGVSETALPFNLYQEYICVS